MLPPARHHRERLNPSRQATSRLAALLLALLAALSVAGFAGAMPPAPGTESPGVTESAASGPFALSRAPSRWLVAKAPVALTKFDDSDDEPSESPAPSPGGAHLSSGSAPAPARGESTDIPHLRPLRGRPQTPRAPPRYPMT